MRVYNVARCYFVREVISKSFVNLIISARLEAKSAKTIWWHKSVMRNSVLLAFPPTQRTYKDTPLARLVRSANASSSVATEAQTRRSASLGEALRIPEGHEATNRLNGEEVVREHFSWQLYLLWLHGPLPRPSQERRIALQDMPSSFTGGNTMTATARIFIPGKAQNLKYALRPDERLSERCTLALDSHSDVTIADPRVVRASCNPAAPTSPGLHSPPRPSAIE